MSATTLLHLPSEILASILSLPAVSHLPIRLWKTGNKKLMSKLQAGITSLELRPLYGWTFRMPFLVTQFVNLRHFAVSSTERIFSNPSQSVPFLKSLPQTLETLEFDTPDLEYLFVNSDYSTGSFRTHYKETRYERGISRYIDIGALLPLLRTLKLSSHPRNTVDASQLFPALPRTLTSLCFGDYYIGTSPFIELLPKSLQTLDVGLIYDSQTCDSDELLQDWRQASPNLQHVGSVSSFTLNMIPDSIQTVGHCELFNSPAQLPSLPASITNLSLPISTIVDCTPEMNNWPARLPSGITQLKIDSDALTPHQVALLPRSITRLSLVLIHGWENFTDPSHTTLNDGALPDASTWPSSLSYLSLALQMTNPSFDVLPRFIKALDIQCFRELEVPDVSRLPPHLTTLDLQYGARLYGEFPASLTNVGLSQLRSLRGTAFSDSLIDLDVGPTSSLSAVSLAVFSDMAPILVSSLQRLTLPSWRQSWFKDIPRGVTFLNISELHPTSPIVDNHDIDIFEELPPNLTHFEVGNVVDYHMHLSGYSFATLTRLNTLVLRNTTVDADALSNLPRTMTRLQITLKSLEPSHLPHLPPLLNDVYLGRSIDWNMPNLAEYWPVYAVNDIDKYHTETLRRVRNRLSALDY